MVITIAGRGSLRSMCLSSFYFLLFPFFCALQASGGKHEASTRKAGGEWREARGECEKGARGKTHTSGCLYSRASL